MGFFAMYFQDALISQIQADHEAERDRALDDLRQDLEARHDSEMTQLEDKLRSELNDTLSQLKVSGKFYPKCFHSFSIKWFHSNPTGSALSGGFPSQIPLLVCALNKGAS